MVIQFFVGSSQEKLRKKKNPGLTECIMGTMKTVTVEPGQAYPLRFHQRIYYSKVESVGSCRFQIHLCILACVCGREFIHQAVKKFLPAQFP